MHKEILVLLNKEQFTEAFNLVVKSYNQRLYWHIRRMVVDHDDADDVLQNTFLKVWRALPNFRSDANIYTWLYRIATNESLTFLQKKRQDMNFEDYANTVAKNLEADAFFDGDEIQLKLQKAIASLPEKQRAVFNLRYFEEMNYREMAEVLETSEGALKASYHHAAKKIEAFFKED